MIISDAEKAFGKEQHPFRIKALSKLSICETFLNKIEKLYLQKIHRQHRIE